MQYVNLALFAGLALLCLSMARRTRTEPARWAAATFGVLGLISLAGLALPDEPDDVSAVAVKVVLLGILLYPVALYRFSSSFERLPRRADVVVVAMAAAVAVATLAVPRFPDEDATRPWWFQLYAIAFLADWAGVGAVVARRLWRAGRGLPGVARNRMRMLSVGAAGLALALLPGLVPPADQPIALKIVAMVLPPASALLFALGFAPPMWLRTIWRRPDQAALRRVELQLIAADNRERVLATVLPHVAALVGGIDASFSDVAVASDDETSVISIPVADGYLVVASGPYSPFFGSDELEMVRSLAAFLELVLERTTLLEAERVARDAAERTSAELETLVYGISHDLKSPVISLLGYLEYLREDHGEAIGPDGLHYLDRMEKAALYMQELLSDLLELSRVGRVAVDATDVDLLHLVNDVSIDLRSKFPEARVEAGDLPVIHMNSSRARQLFTNLIENAARHGGRTDITVRLFSAIRDDGSAVVSVVDDGVGIPQEYREKAFGIFERLSPRDSSPGTGIGLALCRKIVETTGGEVGIIDSPVGTHVRIIFPSDAVRPAARPLIEVS
jgi:signal transduction histidine kinase